MVLLLTGEARLYRPAFSVQATSATTDSNIAISSVDQTRVGDDFDLAAEAQPANRLHILNALGMRSVAVDLPASLPGIIVGDGTLDQVTLNFPARGTLSKTIRPWGVPSTSSTRSSGPSGNAPAPQRRSPRSRPLSSSLMPGYSCPSTHFSPYYLRLLLRANADATPGQDGFCLLSPRR